MYRIQQRKFMEIKNMEVKYKKRNIYKDVENITTVYHDETIFYRNNEGY